MRRASSQAVLRLRCLIVLQHILLALAVGALAGAGIRVATLLGSRGLERLVVAAVCAGAFAVLSGLLLSTVALGSSPILLSLLAFGAWLATRQLVPDLGTRPSAELTGWWSEAARAPGRPGRFGWRAGRFSGPTA
jgi:hypothetical protein